MTQGTKTQTVCLCSHLTHSHDWERPSFITKLDKILTLLNDSIPFSKSITIDESLQHRDDIPIRHSLDSLLTSSSKKLDKHKDKIHRLLTQNQDLKINASKVKIDQWHILLFSIIIGNALIFIQAHSKQTQTNRQRIEICTQNEKQNYKSTENAE